VHKLIKYPFNLLFYIQCSSNSKSSLFPFSFIHVCSDGTNPLLFLPHLAVCEACRPCIARSWRYTLFFVVKDLKPVSLKPLHYLWPGPTLCAEGSGVHLGDSVFSIYGALCSVVFLCCVGVSVVVVCVPLSLCLVYRTCLCIIEHLCRVGGWSIYLL